MKKKWMGLLLVCAMVLGDGTAACAEHYKGDSGWAVDFMGSGMESNFNTSDINDAIYNLQPGDSIDISVALKNTGANDADWWMTNKVLRSLEDTQEAASGGGYTYTLIYENPEGTEKILYTSDTVGGEKEGSEGAGLKEATDSLEEYFFLDALNTGEKGYIYLTVALDGETQGNVYQDTLADLQMNFAVEETSGPRLVPVEEDPNPGPGGEPDSGDGSGGGRGTGRPPKTSDDADIFPYVALSLVSGTGLLILALYSMKQAGKEEKEKGGAGK